MPPPDGPVGPWVVGVLSPVEALPRYAEEELSLSDNDEPPQIAAE